MVNVTVISSWWSNVNISLWGCMLNYWKSPLCRPEARPYYLLLFLRCSQLDLGNLLVFLSLFVVYTLCRPEARLYCLLPFVRCSQLDLGNLLVFLTLFVVYTLPQLATKLC